MQELLNPPVKKNKEKNDPEKMYNSPEYMSCFHYPEHGKR
jgi:hypothetical protein